MVDGAIDVSNFDASWSGGPTVWRKAAGLAAAFGVEVGHHEEPQISAHLLASASHGTYVECFEPERDPFFWNLFASRGTIANGRYAVPSGPGFGIVLDKDYAEHHTVTRVVSTREGRSVPAES
jgi:L-alanine-DL-glutamate epimerase-like enolase superfamily enzyme